MTCRCHRLELDRRALLTCGLLALLALPALAPVSAQQLTSTDVARAVARLRADSDGPVTTVSSPSTGLVGFFGTAPGAPLAGRLPASDPAEARALSFLESYGPAFGIASTRDVHLVEASFPDEVGMEHVRYVQTYRGVPVTGGELTVHLRGAGLVAILGKTVADWGTIDVEPLVGAADAELEAQQSLAERLGVTDAQLSEPRLVLLNRGLLEGRTTRSRLAWLVEATRIDLREYLWIDAKKGGVLLQFSQLTDARDRKIYDANDPGDGVFGELPGTLVRSEGDEPVVGGAAADANAAYDFSGDTYDYFFDEHSRDGYDGAGATLTSTVRFCPFSGSCPFANAFWNGAQMVYGLGFAAADDVAAHELTHAVTEHTANLFYYMQSGALNESFSDIFGETVDLLNGAGTDGPGVRWELGEDVPDFGAIRNMADPTLFNDPGKLSDADFYCGGDYRFDQGGVHHNSGVPNRAYSLMVDGGSYNGQTVTGIGLTKAGKIQYRALAHYLTSASGFLDDYHALKQSCTDLQGIAGITAGDCVEVDKALVAVEMDEVWPCSPTTQSAVPSLCPADQAPSIAYFNDMENIPLPACPAMTLPGSWCTTGPASLLGAYATSGDYSLWGYNRGTAGTLVLQVSLPEGDVLPAGSRLQFDHAFGFENSGTTYYDGGRVEYSDDGGTNWSDAGPLIVAGQTYGGTISNARLNPLGGQSAFVAESWGFTATQLDLSASAGNDFAYRFLLGTDIAVDEYGWFLDDFRIYSCSACVANRLLDHAYNGTAALYRASSITAGSGFAVGLAEDVVFEANTIILQPGFKVGGGRFTARSAPCI
jgi:Zn-dependent metalloprotease